MKYTRSRNRAKLLPETRFKPEGLQQHIQFYKTLDAYPYLLDEYYNVWEAKEPTREEQLAAAHGSMGNPKKMKVQPPDTGQPKQAEQEEKQGVIKGEELEETEREQKQREQQEFQPGSPSFPEGLPSQQLEQYHFVQQEQQLYPQQQQLYPQQQQQLYPQQQQQLYPQQQYFLHQQFPPQQLAQQLFFPHQQMPQQQLLQQQNPSQQALLQTPAKNSIEDLSTPNDGNGLLDAQVSPAGPPAKRVGRRIMADYKKNKADILMKKQKLSKTKAHLQAAEDWKKKTEAQKQAYKVAISKKKRGLKNFKTSKN